MFHTVDPYKKAVFACLTADDKTRYCRTQANLSPFNIPFTLPLSVSFSCIFCKRRSDPADFAEELEISVRVKSQDFHDQISDFNSG